MNLDFKGKQGDEPESPLFYFRSKKRLLRWDSNPRAPAFKAVAHVRVLCRILNLGENLIEMIMKCCIVYAG